MGILEVKDVSLTFNGKKILDEVNLYLEKGNVYALVGPNGAGKTTLAFTIMGLAGYRDMQGDILLEGSSIKNLSLDERARQGITLAWQEPARYEGLSVEKFIQAGCADKGNGEIVKNALLSVGLDPDEYLSRAVDKTLSGGERKKIELASILAMQPKIVMLDEPDSGIDVASLEKIFDSLKLLRGYNSTVMLITHSLTVLKQADYAFLMCCGKIIDWGRIKKISRYFEEKCISCGHKNIPELEWLNSERSS
ncbi:ABC transporter ATP-binding protein [Candidatus Aerophobetes bacterium]|nr:ABC transporter ATP-binding protein [Candidatus Aerophobetes bacterium]